MHAGIKAIGPLWLVAFAACSVEFRPSGTCRDSRDCPWGTYCESAVCVAGCQGDGDCPSGMLCQAGSCQSSGGVVDGDGGTGPYEIPQQQCATVGDDAIEGRVVVLGGVPVSGAIVIVNGCRTETDADGRFRAAGIPTPFTLSVLFPS